MFVCLDLFVRKFWENGEKEQILYATCSILVICVKNVNFRFCFSSYCIHVINTLLEIDKIIFSFLFKQSKTFPSAIVGTLLGNTLRAVCNYVILSMINMINGNRIQYDARMRKMQLSPAVQGFFIDHYS